jgi:hypothetical protein
VCRCDWDGTGDHPCHSNGYGCRKPAKERFYEPTIRYALAGAQLKMSVTQTWACDECWEKFSKQLEARYEQERQDIQESLGRDNGQPGKE